MQPLVILNTVGLTSSLLKLAPRLHALAQRHWSRPLQEVLPAVTCTAQASMLTGKLPQEHGIVGNGWLYRDTMEVRFWHQSNRLIQAEPVYEALLDQAPSEMRPFSCAKLFWWFNQGATVDIAITPKPHYGADGSKAFDVQSCPPDWSARITERIGPFPFASFWGPMAGLPSTQWIGLCAGEIISEAHPHLTLVYLPHLDYEPQRLGCDDCHWGKIVRELDDACMPILDAANTIGAAVWVVNEYTHVQVDRPVYINQILRASGLLRTREGPFGEQYDVYASDAFAVCDHQIAHVYLRRAGLRAGSKRVYELLQGMPDVDRVYAGEERAEIGLDHPRAGDLVVLAKPNAWFAYPFWLDDRKAPDYARTVDIHRKPGYDPCELFFDPKLFWPKGRAIAKVLMKKLGLRTLVDVIPLDASLVRGSHGLSVPDPLDKPVFIGSGSAPSSLIVHQTEVRDFILRHFGL
jgi:predicted AlkP superfamily pyrophosphatase or phosphodiesterase